MSSLLDLDIEPRNLINKIKELEQRIELLEKFALTDPVKLRAFSNFVTAVPETLQIDGDDVIIDGQLGVKLTEPMAENLVVGGELGDPTTFRVQVGGERISPHQCDIIVNGSFVEITSYDVADTLALPLILSASEFEVNIDSIGVALKVDSSGDVYSTALTDYSAMSTITGWSSLTKKLIFYKQIGKSVFVQFELAGTSNSMQVSFTLPHTTTANPNEVTFPIVAIDNGSIVNTPVGYFLGGSNIFACFKDVYGTTWTASGNKLVRGMFEFQAS